MSEYYKSETIANSQGQKAIVSIPAWAQAFHDGELGKKDVINNPAAAYAFVPLIFRATRLVCNALVSVPTHFYKGNTEVEWMFPEVSKYWLLWRSQAAMSLVGANYVEKIPRVRSKKVGGLQWVNPVTMTAYAARNEDKSYSYTFQQGQNGATWTQDEMIYMREFTLAGYGQSANGKIHVPPGDSSASVSMNDAALLRYMSRFAARFFEGGAMPVTLVSIDGLLDKDETKRVEGFFKKAMTGIVNAWRVLAVSRQIEAKVISQPIKDLVIPELANQARRSVADAFDFHPSLLEEAPNMATAQEHRLSLYQDSVMPRALLLQEEFNRQLFAPLGYRMEFGFEEMDIFQEDENDKSQTVVNITTAISTDPEAAQFAMNIMGYDLNEKQLSQLNALIADRKKKEDETGTTPPQEQPVTETTTETPPAKAVYADDLARWERKALRVFKETGTAVCQYVSDVLPAEIRAKVEAGLQSCKSVEDVRQLFDVEPVTATRAPEYRSNPDAKALADSINKLADVYLKSQTVDTTQALLIEALKGTRRDKEDDMQVIINNPANVDVTSKETIKAVQDMASHFEALKEIVKATPPPVVTVNIPEQVAPVVNVQTPEQPAPQIVVNVPEQSAPVNNITVQPADVNIDIPKPKRERQKVKRNKQGFIESTDTQIEYEE